MATSNPTRNRPGTAAFTKGQETIGRILDTAWRLAVDEGFDKLSIRRIARELEISPGNLSYYYASRTDLIGALLTRVIEGYIAVFDQLRIDRADSPEEQLRAIISYVIDDLGTRETTLFFPELWRLANRDEQTTRQLEQMYDAYRVALEEIIAQMCADPNPRVHKDLALVIVGSTEGQTVFMGHNRPHRARAAQLKALIVEQSIAMVTSVPKP